MPGLPYREIPINLDGSQRISPGSISISVVESASPVRFVQVHIVGYGEIGRTCIGYHPFVVGVDQVGHMI